MRRALEGLFKFMPSEGGQSLVNFMRRVTKQEIAAQEIAVGVKLIIDPETKKPTILATSAAAASTDFSRLRVDLLQSFNLPASTKIVSVFGDSQSFGASGSNVAVENLEQFFASSTPEAVALYGATGRTLARDSKGNPLTDVNAAVGLSGQASLMQVVDQTKKAITAWGCDARDPASENVKGIIYVTNSSGPETVFGDDIGLEGWLDSAKIDPALIVKISQEQNLPENIAAIINHGKKLNDVERQQLMYFAVEREIDFSDILSLEEVLVGGIGDEAFMLGSGAQGSWQGFLNVLLGKKVTAIGGLRGAENAKTTIKVTGGDEVEREEYRDFLDGSEILGYLAQCRKENPEVDFFTVWKKYFNGNESRGYPLSGIRLVYNPGNEDVARADEAKGGLNSKMRLVTNAAFAFGCLGGYKLLNPALVDCKILTPANELLPYEVAAKAGLAPSLENPQAGKYHDHNRREPTKTTEAKTAQQLAAGRVAATNYLP